MRRNELLNNLSFGKVDSESEEALDKIFIQTSDFAKFLQPDTYLVLGAKGAGKSALFRLFTVFEKSARKMSGTVLDNVYISSGTGFKDISNMDYAEINSQMQGDIFDFQAAWKIYCAYKAVYSLFDSESIIAGENSKKILVKADKVQDRRAIGWIRKFFSNFLGDMPDIEAISFGDISIRTSKNTKISVLDTLREINDYLACNGKTLWILIDKIDELFSEKQEVRKKCIEGLFLTLIDFTSRYTNIKLKIFLRTDIWGTLNFVNKSHITDKQIRLSWDTNDLGALLVKRACLNDTIKNWILDETSLTFVEDDYKRCFYKIFADKPYPGRNESSTLNYMYNRTSDGLDGVYPREWINFGNTARDYCKRDELNEIDVEIFDTILSGISIREAFPVVSKTKVESYLSEFQWLSQHFKRFEGKTQTEFSKHELFTMMKGLDPSGEDMIRQLHETGIIKPNISSLASATSFSIPRLFRPGLGIITLGRP